MESFRVWSIRSTFVSLLLLEWMPMHWYHCDVSHVSEALFAVFV